MWEYFVFLNCTFMNLRLFSIYIKVFGFVQLLNALATLENCLANRYMVHWLVFNSMEKEQSSHVEMSFFFAV